MDTFAKLTKLTVKLAQKELASPSTGLPTELRAAFDAVLVHLRRASFGDSRLDAVVDAVSAVMQAHADRKPG